MMPDGGSDFDEARQKAYGLARDQLPVEARFTYRAHAAFASGQRAQGLLNPAIW